MKLFPAIDLLNNNAVRLFKGDYAQVTVYNSNPVAVAQDFKACGAEQIHLVDLSGAKSGVPEHAHILSRIVEETGLFVEIGGGIRSMQTIEKYLSVGAGRVILGTAAVTDEPFLKQALFVFGDKIAVGADIADGKIAIKGWVEKSQYSTDDFLKKMQDFGVKTVICTDISKDGAMKGANHTLYKDLTEKFSINFIASGGVSSLDDIKILRDNMVYGAIVGKAYYIGAIDIREGIKLAKRGQK